MAGLITLEVLGSSPLAAAVRATPLEWRAEPLIWVCDATPDLPLGAFDDADVHSVVISSPVPVGTIARLEKLYPFKWFAYIQENVRRASPISDFQNTERFIIGTRHIKFYELLAHMLAPVCPLFHWVTPESAELSKLALNAFLSLNIAFMHEIEALCLATGADADEVSRTLLTERRVSPDAPLRPGPSWGGDHLAREVATLQRMSRETGVRLPLISQLRSEP